MGFTDWYGFFLFFAPVLDKKGVERIGTRRTRILRIYTDFLEFMIEIQHKFQKNPCKFVKSVSSVFPFVS
ncbi:MAG: hypothetical protein RLZZ628_4453 [Bacteroidota bacterium]|jgi:hypothetical protein